ncbi:MAG: hypothetical protein ACLUI3_08145 [Christensenellales bacterium]
MDDVRFVTLDELLADSDVVSLHCPLTGEKPRHDRRGGDCGDEAGRSRHQHGARAAGR